MDDEEGLNLKICFFILVKREFLKRRDYDVDFEVNFGKLVVIIKIILLLYIGGYYCNVCDCVVKDFVNFLDYINGKKY